MTYHAGGLTIIGDSEYGLGRVVRVASTYSGTVQLYVSGVLTDAQPVVGGVATFTLNAAGSCDVLFFLAVDAGDGGVDYFADAFPVAAANGNRIRVDVPAKWGYSVGDTVQVVRTDTGGATANITIYEGRLFPNGTGSIGWGRGEWGDTYGYDGTGRGWGYGWGYQWGFGCSIIEAVSEPLPTGVYGVSVTITDAAGNASTAATATVTLATYPRPASNLAVASYTGGNLRLTWTASPDIT